MFFLCLLCILLLKSLMPNGLFLLKIIWIFYLFVCFWFGCTEDTYLNLLIFWFYWNISQNWPIGLTYLTTSIQILFHFFNYIERVSLKILLNICSVIVLSFGPSNYIYLGSSLPIFSISNFLCDSCYLFSYVTLQPFLLDS